VNALARAVTRRLRAAWVSGGLRFAPPQRGAALIRPTPDAHAGYTDGMNFITGYHWPSKVGGHGTDMNTSNTSQMLPTRITA
jgi:hypothetical protein